MTRKAPNVSVDEGSGAQSPLGRAVLGYVWSLGAQPLGVGRDRGLGTGQETSLLGISHQPGMDALEAPA